MQKSLILLSIILVSSCATTVVVPMALRCPDPLVLPKIPDYIIPEVALLSRDTAEYFMKRDQMQTARRATLQDICRSTHE